MNAKTDDKVLTVHLDTLHVIRDAARAARQRIVDGRAKEAMAIFEHELTNRLETFARAQPEKPESPKPSPPRAPLPPVRPSAPPPPAKPEVKS
jgi:hypothetical protein